MTQSLIVPEIRTYKITRIDNGYLVEFPGFDPVNGWRMRVEAKEGKTIDEVFDELKAIEKNLASWIPKPTIEQ